MNSNLYNTGAPQFRPITTAPTYSTYAYTAPLGRFQTTFGSGVGATLQSASRGAGAGFVSFIAGFVNGLFSNPVQTVSNLATNFSGPPAGFVNNSPNEQPQFAPQNGQTVQQIYIISYHPQQLPQQNLNNDINSYISAGGTQTGFSPQTGGTANISGQGTLQQVYTSPAAPGAAGSPVAAAQPTASPTDIGSAQPLGLGPTAGLGSDIAGPINLLAPGWSSIASGLSGGWAGGETLYADQAALAQAQTNQDALQAQLEALQAARDAGICGDNCTASIASLQSQLVTNQDRINSLTTAVGQDQALQTSLPSPGIQIAQYVHAAASGGTGVLPSLSGSVGYTGGTSQQINGIASGPTSVYSPSLPPSPATAVEQGPQGNVSVLSNSGVIGQVVQGVWDFVTGLFTPKQQQATSTAPQAHTCSLFASLFQGCK